MDWFSWLSKTNLEPSLVYEYGLIFAQNELEEEDMLYFNHEFLQSMGISIAKHRLEILKLAKKDKRKSQHPVAKFVAAIKKTKKSLANYVRTLTHTEESALVVMPTRQGDGFGRRWKSAMMKRNKKFVVAKQEKMFLKNGNSSMPSVVVPALSGDLDGFSSPVVYHFQKEQKMDGDDGGVHKDNDDDDDNGYWSAAVEEIKWDTMFKDLKPN
ncbi:sterile alpha motif (SAM) domain-containing protein [Trifolium repens]|jgi:hypothetical protein|nr:sterile alpha motif (SAM) domain-containing protein [Trifolium repens]